MTRNQWMGIFIDMILLVPVALVDRCVFRFGSFIRPDDFDFGFPKIA
jgi:hypothetical protein